MEALLLFSPSELPIIENPNPKPCLSKEERKAINAANEFLKKTYEAAQQCFTYLDKSIFVDKSKVKKKVENRSFVEEPDNDHHQFELATAEDDLAVLGRMSSDRLWRLHEYMFEESMEALKAEGNHKEKLEILEWIFTPNYIEKIGKSFDGRPYLLRRHALDIPFSFLNCCRAVGSTDPDSFREGLVSEMSDDFRLKLERYLQLTTGWEPPKHHKSHYVAESEENEEDFSFIG